MMPNSNLQRLIGEVLELIKQADPMERDSSILPLNFTLAVVQSVQTTTCTIQINGTTTNIAGIHWLNPTLWTPVATNVVACLESKGMILILGRIS